MLVIGLTGGIAAGKSSVLKIFEELGAKTIDADLIAHKVLEPKTDVWKALVDYFGKRILNKDLIVDRKKIADIVFTSSQDLARLNQIAHPPIIKEIIKSIYTIFEKEKDCIIMVDAPLLFESYIAPLMDKIIVVTIPARTQIQRLIRRDGLTNLQAKLRISSQMPQEVKVKYADYIINGTDKITKITEQVNKIWQDLLKESSITQETKVSKIYFKN